MHERPVVVFSGGGTGGHLYPALAIADELRERRPDVRAVFIGAERGIEARILPARGEEYLLLPVHGIDRSRRLGNWRAITGLFTGLVRVVRLFTRLHPEVVVVTGGYAGAAAGIGAGLMGYPLVLQEQNSWPGAVTKLLTRFASRVHVAYPEAIDRLSAAAGRIVVSGNPVRDRSNVSRRDARTAFGVPSDARVALVIGGSQGSVALNGVMLELIEAVQGGGPTLPAGLHFLWATGPKHFDSVTAALDRTGTPEAVHVVAYFDDMPSALAAADVAVSRAGAMSTAELLNQGLPALLVPLPTSAEGHQMYNARALESAGAAIVVPQSELTAELLVEHLRAMTASGETLEAMTRCALDRARPDARTDIAADVATFLASDRSAP